ncbi:MAG: branched-chain amino acid ABC transporter permease [Caldilineaceae bacterium]
MLQRFWPAIVLIIPLLLIAILVHFLGGVVLQRIVTVMFINLILVLGLQMFSGNSGVLSFGHIAFMGMGAYGSILFSMSPQAKGMALRQLYEPLTQVHLPFLPALLIGALIATVVAALVGVPLMRLSGPASVIATFALLVITHVVFINWEEVTNGARTIFGVDSHTTLWQAAAWALLFVIVAYAFKETALGLKLRAAREDEKAAAAIGIDIVQVRWAAFVLSAFVTAVAGALWAHFITSFSPVAFYLSQTFLIVAMLIIGGSGSVAGAVIGTVAVTIIFEGMRGVENAVNMAQLLPFSLSGLTQLVLSVAMILILIFRPAGIMRGREIGWLRGNI